MPRLITLLLFVGLAAFVVSGANAAGSPWSFYGGLGYGKALNDGAPGGSIGLQGGVIYTFPNSPQFGIGGEVGYLMLGKESRSECFGLAGCADADVTWSTIPITAQGYYFLQSKGSSAPYLTGGLGFYDTEVEVDVNVAGFGGGSASASETDLGLNFGGGVKMGKGDGMKFGGDGRFALIMSDGESIKLITIMARIFFGG